MSWDLVGLAASAPWACVAVTLFVISPRILKAMPAVIDARSRSRLTRAIVASLASADRDAPEDLLDLLKHLNDPHAKIAGLDRRPGTLSARKPARPTLRRRRPPRGPRAASDEPMAPDKPTEPPLQLVGW